MSEHIADELPLLLTGEAGREVVMAAAAHLRVCPDCQQDLVSAVVAHASLTSAHRFAPEIVAPESDADRSDSDASVAPISGRTGEPTLLPDLSIVFARAREDAVAAEHSPRRSRRLTLAVAAAAVIVVGGGVTGGVLAVNSDVTPSAHTVQLEAYPAGNNPGTVTVQGSRLQVNASKLPRLDTQHIYELWVTNAARTKMQSVGTIDNDNRAELTVPPNVLSRYSDFEVSVQRINQLNTYSGKSVLRGAYS